MSVPNITKSLLSYTKIFIWSSFTSRLCSHWVTCYMQGSFRRKVQPNKALSSEFELAEIPSCIAVWGCLTYFWKNLELWAAHLQTRKTQSFAMNLIKVLLRHLSHKPCARGALLPKTWAASKSRKLLHQRCEIPLFLLLMILGIDSELSTNSIFVTFRVVEWVWELLYIWNSIPSPTVGVGPSRAVGWSMAKAST